MKIPRDLRTEGKALLQRVTTWLDEEKMVLDPHEEVVLLEACRVTDRLSMLRKAIEGQDLATAGAVRLLAEERQQRTALANLLVTKLGFPTGVLSEDESSTGSSPRSRRAQNAANSRWGYERQRRGAAS